MVGTVLLLLIVPVFFVVADMLFNRNPTPPRDSA